MQRWLVLAVLAVLAVLSGACSSSVGSRPRDGGPGPDDGGGAARDGAGGADAAPLAPRFSPCRGRSASTGLPVTDPGARWEREGYWSGITIQGYLDGPRTEMRSFAPAMPAFFEDGNDFVLRAHDPETDRFVTVAGGARGYLDGPFSRARFSGWGYGGGLTTACAPDGALYIGEPALRTIRRLDFATQTVATVMTDVDALALAFRADGTMLVVDWGKVTTVSPDGQVLSSFPFPAGATPSHGFSAALDEPHQRLYAANRCAGDWYVWYWDLAAGGAFTGVLAMPTPESNPRAQNTPGPFAGANLHCPAGISFGPDDPEHRYLYYGGGDFTSFWRLDLVDRMVDAFGPDDPTESPYRTFRFTHDLDFALGFGSVSSWCGGPSWGPDNNAITVGMPIYSATIRFRRTQ